MTAPGRPHHPFEVPRTVQTSPDTSTQLDLAGAGAIPCVTGDPETWFAEQPEVLEHAKALCGPCPLREMCLQGALERGEPWGVWGGELFDRGRVIPRKRTVGRPRKDRAA